jgi:PleD family two-component response regulator
MSGDRISGNGEGPAVEAPPEDYVCMVLLVDDQAIVGESVRRMLAPHRDIDYHYCSNPLDAIAAVDRIKPTVILQDLVMPGIDGLSLVRQYRARPATEHIPVVVLSTTEDPAVKSEAFATGASDYLVKVPDEIELVARVRFHSRAYLNQIQRDEAYRALRESQRQLTISNTALAERVAQLEEALWKVKQLSGLLPICSYCKRIRTDHDYWQRVDHYIAEHSEAKFSHGICPECFKMVSAELDRYEKS